MGDSINSNEQIKHERYPHIHHFIFWVIIAIYINYTITAENESVLFALKLSAELLTFMLMITYTHFYFFQKYFWGRKFILYGAALISVIACYGILFQIYFTKYYNYTNSLVQTLASVLFILFVTTALKIFRRTYYQKIKLNEIYAKQLETELSLLKSQVNPHFLFNTLNSIYGLSLEKSDVLPDTIIKLSDLMRYLLNAARQDKVLLKDEISFIENYIALEKLRLQGDYKIEFIVKGTYDRKFITPMVLIPLVENCFKHGFDFISRSGFVKILISISGNYLEFVSSNSNFAADKKNNRTGGSGIDNLKRRMNLIYRENYSIDVKISNDEYNVTLRVIL